MRMITPENIVVEFCYADGVSMPDGTALDVRPGAIMAVILGSPESVEQGLGELPDDEVLSILARATEVGNRLERIGFMVRR